MSFKAVTPIFDNCLKDLEYIEWPDEYTMENIPGDLLDCTYHLEIGAIAGSAASHTSFEFSFPVVLTIHSKQVGTLSTSEETNNLLGRIDDILCKVLAAETRYSEYNDGVKSIIVSGIDIGALDNSNLNITRAQITFQVTLIADYRTNDPHL